MVCDDEAVSVLAVEAPEMTGRETTNSRVFPRLNYCFLRRISYNNYCTFHLFTGRIPVNVNITGKQMDLTEDLKSSVHSMVERLPRYFDRINYVDVVFDSESNQVQAEVIVSTVRGITLVGKSTDYDAFKSLDEASDKIIRQLKKLNDKLNEKRDRTRSASSPNPADREQPGDTPPDEEL